MAAGPRVCLVDDDEFVRDALTLGLNDAGYDVIAAPSAAAGLDVGRRQTIDAIVTDMNMPGASGAQFVVEARAEWPDMPIVVISGHAAIDGRPIADVARELGANAALIKPFRARALAAALDDLLKRAPRG